MTFAQIRLTLIILLVLGFSGPARAQDYKIKGIKFTGVERSDKDWIVGYRQGRRVRRPTPRAPPAARARARARTVWAAG